MWRFVRRFLLAVLIVAGTPLLATVGLQHAVNHHAFDGKIHRICSDFLDADLNWSRLNVSLLRHFPVVSVAIEGLSLTYPHDRFPERVRSTAAKSFFDLGRGEAADTLLSVSGLSVSVDIFELACRRITLNEIAVDGLRAFAHQYDSLANWAIFRKSEEPDTLSEPSEIPPVYLGKVRISNGPFLAYTSGDIAASVLLDVKLRYADLSSLPEVNCGADVGIPVFNLDAEGIKASGNASATFDMDSLGIRAGLLVPDIPMDKTLRSILADYAPAFSSLKAGSGLHLDVSGAYGKSGVADVSLNDITLKADGLLVSMDGTASDILGKDPGIKLDARADIVLDSLVRFIPDSLGLDASGRAAFNVRADTRLSEFRTLSFRKSDFEGRLSSRDLRLTRQKDSLLADMDNLLVSVHSGRHGLELTADVDTLLAGKGEKMAVRGRKVHAGGLMKLVEYRGHKVPYLGASVHGGGLFLRLDRHKFGLSGVKLEASAKRRIKRRPRPATDSLHNSARIPVDSAIINLWDRWKPELALNISRVFIATPALPLRTRARGIGMSFSDNDIRIDSLKANCGVSDLNVSGSLKNLRRALHHRAPVDLDLAVKSEIFNLNEILNALEYAGKTEVKVSGAENDESFVVDSLSGTKASKASLNYLMLPEGFEGDITLDAGNFRIFDISATNCSALVSARDRCVQVKDAKLFTNFGDIDCSLFYRTPGDRYSSVGVDLKMTDVDAAGIIHLVPAIDKMIPALQSFKGKLGCEVSATSRMGKEMFLDLPSLDGIVRIRGNDLRIDDAGDLKRITRLLLFRNKNIGHIDDMRVDAIIHDNKLELFPFILGVDRYRLAMSGVQGFDKSMDYHISVLKSPLPIRIGINISGKEGAWHYSLCRPKYKSDRVPVFTQQLDAMQLDIGAAIRNILKTGASESAGQGNKAVLKFKKEAGVRTEDLTDSSAPLSAEEFIKVDSLNFVEDIRESDEELQADMDAIMADAVESASKLMQEYEALKPSSRKSKKNKK